MPRSLPTIIGNVAPYYNISPNQVGSSSYTQVSAGNNFTTAVQSTNALYGWGLNTSGQVGDATTISKSTPVQLLTGTSFSQVKSGLDHSLAIKSDGTLYAWGNPLAFPVASGTTISSWTQVYAGWYYTLAITSDNRLFTWGGGTSGVLGIGSTTNRSSPVLLGSGYTQLPGPGSYASHAAAIKSDGTLWMWGTNNQGQFGYGDTINRSSPVQIPGSWNQVYLGNNSTYALKSDASLWVWGFNGAGQLALNDAISRSSPVQVTNPSVSWSQIAAGLSYALGLDTLGRMYGWGLNSSNQLGTMDGAGLFAPVSQRSLAVQIGTSSWTNIAAAYTHSAGIKPDGTLWTWGEGAAVGLVVTAQSWSAVATGSSHTLAIDKLTGKLWGTGLNNFGQLGVFDASNRTSPTLVSYTSSYTQVAAGQTHSAAIDVNGAAYVWGYSGRGEIGDNSAVTKSLPVQVGVNFTVVDVSTASTNTITKFGTVVSTSIVPVTGAVSGYFSGVANYLTTPSNASFAFGTNAYTVEAWVYLRAISPTWGAIFEAGNATNAFEFLIHASGYIYLGLYGVGAVAQTTAGDVPFNTWAHIAISRVTTGTNDTRIFVNGAVKLAFTDTNNWTVTTTPSIGGYTASGYYLGGFLSNLRVVKGTGVYSGTFTPPSLAVLATTGAGSAAAYPSTTNVDVTFVAANTSLLLYTTLAASITGAATTAFSQVSTGEDQTLLVSRSGPVYVTGGNAVGQLGLGDVVSRSNYVILPGSTSWTTTSAGLSFSAAISTTGALYTWGLNTAGYLGINDTINRSSPVLVAAGWSWTAISSGREHTLAIRSDGSLWTWGGSGAIGLVVETQSWASLSAGSSHTLGVRSDGGLFAWGIGTSGQIGDVTAISKSSPTQIGTSSWSLVAAGNNFSLALDTNKKLYAWGTNATYQLGTGDSINRSSPTAIGTSSWVAITAGNDHSIAVKLGGTLWGWGNNSNGQVGPYGVTNNSWISATTSSDASAAVRSDGTLWTWGLNNAGQLGLTNVNVGGDTLNRSSPVQVGALTNWSQVSMGASFTTAINTSGIIYTWGLNNAFQLGTGDSVNRSSPVLLTATGSFSTSSFTTVSAGGSTVHAIKATGALFGWGLGTSGEVGDGTALTRSIPTQVGSLSWNTVSTGHTFRAGITNVSTLYTWGLNNAGQLGTGDTLNRSAPNLIGTSSWTLVAAGSSHAVASTIDFRLHTWGLNASGQLGQNDAVNRSTPTQVLAANYIGSWTTLAAGADQTAAATGWKILAWGLNTNGGLGDGTTVNKSTPSISTTTDAIALRFNQAPAGSSQHGWAIRSDGSLWNWGINTNGQAGDGTSVTNRSVAVVLGNWPYVSSPVQIGSNAGSWSEVSAGASYTLGISTAGLLYGWGINNSNQTGYPVNTYDRNLSASLVASGSWTEVSAGNNHALAVKSDYTLWTWGAPTAANVAVLPVSWTAILSQGGSTFFTMAIRSDGALFTWGVNSFGQLGIGDTLSRSSPTQIGMNNSWSAIAASPSTSMAIRADGKLFAWGYNLGGQIGDGTIVNQSSPIQIGNSSWTNIASGAGGVSYAIRTDGGLFAWGAGAVGQIGDGTTATNRSSPIQIGSSSWSAISTSTSSTYAISANRLYAWGYNAQNQLGDGSTLNRSSPTIIGNWLGKSWSSVSAGGTHAAAITSLGELYAWGQAADISTNLNSWSQIASGLSHTVGLRNDGMLFAWGNNASGQLGTGDTLNRSIPVLVGALTGGVSAYTQIGAGDNTTFAIRSEGTLWAAGINTAYQLGDGTAVNKSNLVQVYGPTLSWTKISAGTDHGAAITASTGKLYTWGTNTVGQLGDNTVLLKSVPTLITGTPSWNIVSAGQSFTAAIDTVGKLFTWGLNSSWQLGDGTSINKSSPVQIGTSASSYTQVSVGINHGLAISFTGGLYGWGTNNAGQIGIGNTLNRSFPVQIGSSSWTLVDAGISHSSAIGSNGTLWAWGLGTTGQLGQNDTLSRSNPVQIGYGSNWIAISAGGSSTGAINSSNLFNWGLGTSGQLGDNTAISKSFPLQVGSVTFTGTAIPSKVDNYSYTQVTAGASYTLARLASTNGLYGWGLNSSGQLGDNNTAFRVIPSIVGTTVTLTDDTGLNTLTRVGGVYPVPINPFPAPYNNTLVYGGSLRFVGTKSSTTAGYVSMPAISSYIIPASNTPFTIEAWIFQIPDVAGVSIGGVIFCEQYVVSPVGPVNLIFALTAQADINSYGQVSQSADPFVSFGWYNGSTFTTAATSTVRVSPGQWNHIAAVFTGSTSKIYINGIDVTYTGVLNTPATSWGVVGNAGDGSWYIGVPQYITSTQTFFAGLISNLRWVIGTAVYTANFTPSTTPLTTTQSANVNGSPSAAIASGTVLLAAKDTATPRAYASVSALNSNAYAIDSSSRAYAWGSNVNNLYGDQSGVTRSSPIQVGTSFVGINNGTGSPVLVIAAGTSWSLVSAGTSFSAATTTDKVLYNWGLNTSGQLADSTAVTKSAPVLLGTVLADASSQKAAVAPVIGSPAISATVGPVTGGFSELLSGTTQMFGFATGYTSTYNWIAGQDFTMELWAYPTNTNARTLVNFGTYIVSYTAEYLLTITNTYVDIWISGGSTSSATQYQAFYPSSASLTANTWNHIALVRYNNNLTAYLNGVAGVSVSAAGAAQPGSASPSPGQSELGMWFGIDRTNWTTPSNNLYFAGYLSNIRYNKGTAVYTGNFTPPSLANLATTGAGSAAAYPSTTNVNTTFADSTTFMLLLVPASITGYTFNLISAGAAHFTGVTTSNLLYDWGLGTSGQLGDNTAITKSSPVLIGNSAYINTGTGLPVRVNFGINESWAGVAAGWSQSLGLTTTGKLYTWGYNAQGQLGNNTVSIRSIPAQIGTTIYDTYGQGISLPTSWSFVAAGNYQQFAIASSDSSLWGWGQNNVYQLGTNYTNNISNPTQIGFGQIQGISQYAGSPVQVRFANLPVSQSWSSVSVGQSISGAVSTDNILFVWGNQSYVARGGQGAANIPVRSGVWNYQATNANYSFVDKAGNYTVSGFTNPYIIDYITNVMPANPFPAPYNDPYLYGGAMNATYDGSWYKAMTVGATASAQSISTGDFTIEAFVYIPDGVLGGGRILDYGAPTAYMTFSAGSSVSTYTMTVLNAAYPTYPNKWYHIAWTRQSGVERLYINGTYVATYSATLVDYTTGFGAGTLWVGYDAYNGTGGNARYISNVRFVKGLAVYTGTSNFTVPTSPLAVISGSGYSTQLLMLQDLPFTRMISNTTQISTGQAHFYSRNTSSLLWAWGTNSDGRVGFNSAVAISNPNTLGSQLNSDTLSPVIAASGSYSQLGAGASTSAAIRTTGELFMWGLNNAGQMGQSDVFTRSSPTQLGTSSWSQVSAGGSTVFARNSSGSIYIWGLNTTANYGLFNFSNTSNNRSSPVVVGNFYIAVNQSSPIQIGTGSWKQVSAGTSFTAAIKSSDSSLWMWGLGSSGQLGKGTAVTWSSPTQIGTSSYTQVAAGNDHTLAIFSSGTLGSWGNNAQGQLGIGTTVNRTTVGPLAAAFQSLSWINISAGLSYSLAVDATGYQYAWGIGTTGQLGDNTVISKSNPVLIGTKRTNFADTSTNNTLTAVGNAYIGGENPFISPYNATATYGGCGAFDGTGDYITTPASASNSSFGTDDFTVECWIYPSAAATNITIVSSNYSYSTSAGNWGFYFGVGSASTMYFNSGVANDNTTHSSTTTTTITARIWTHVAYVRGSGIGRFFVNGTQLGSNITDTSNYLSSTGTLYIGSMADGTYQMNGFISNLRIVDGIAVYTGNFTPSTIPLPLYQEAGTNIAAINGAQVTLLALQDNTTIGTIFDSVTASTGTNSGGISNDKLLYVWGYDNFGIGLAQGAVPGFRSNPTLMGNVYAMSNVYSPMQLGAGTWLAVAAGTSYTVAIDTSYRLWAWGNNGIGQLGDKSVISKSSPTQVGFNEWNAITAGISHTAGLTKTS